MEKIATELKATKEVKKVFKKDNIEVFKRNMELNKSIKQLSDELVVHMKAGHVESYEFDGMEFNIKNSTTNKHDMEKLNEIIGDTGKYEEYVGVVSVPKAEVRTRKSKRERDTD
jgi:hypothetical protein